MHYIVRLQAIKQILIAIFLAVLLFPLPANAEECILYVSGQMNWKPFLMKNNAGEVHGLMYEILEYAARKNNCKLQYRDFPWKRAVVSLEKGKIDIICGFFWNKKRAETILFSPPILRNELHIFAHDAFKLESLNDLKGKKGDKIRGSSYGDKFDDFVSSGKATFNEVPDHQTAIKRLIRNYSDFFIGTYIDTCTKLSEQGLGNEIVPLPYVVDTVDVYFAYPKGSKKTHYYNKINKTLADMQRNGTIAAMIKAYFKGSKIDSGSIVVPQMDTELVNAYFIETGIDTQKVIFKPKELRGH